MTEEQFHSSLFPSEVDIDVGAPDGVPPPKSKSKRSIGSILVEAGVISRDDAIRVMEYQQEHRLRFGDAAIRLGLISEGDIRYALSYQYEFSYLPRSSGRATNVELVAAYAPFGHEVDQLRAVRSQLKLRWFDREKSNRMLAVVGAGRMEGVSYLAANLAIVFAQMGERCLLIDTDMRSPRVHELFQLNNQLGFSSLLAGRSDVASALHKVSFLPKLEVIPAGPIPPNPLELLNRDNLEELFQWAGKTYDIVLLDTTPASAGSDATLIAAKCGAAITVARTNHTKLSAYKNMVHELKQSGVDIVGSVMNDPPIIDVVK